MIPKRTKSESPSGSGTALGGKMTHEDQEQFDSEQTLRRQALDRARVVILDGWTAAYQAGVVPFDSMCRGVVAAAAVLPDDMGMVGLIGGRDRLIGYAIRTAVENPPTGKGRRNSWPPLFKEMAANLVRIVHEREGCALKPSRHEPLGKSAYARVVELFSSAGVGVGERSIEEWCSEYRKSSNLRDD